MNSTSSPSAAHGGQETAHLGQRRAAGPLDAPERIAVVGLCLGKLVPDGADLEHHDADRVGDDVVQLARDASALLGHGDARRRLTLPFCPHGTCLRRLGLLRSRAQSEAYGPGDSELDGNQDELCGRVTGDVVNNRRNACEDDHQAGPRLPGVAQIPEQGGGRQPDDEQALDRRDQDAVDKGQRRREDPVGSRSAEGKPPAGEERQHQDRQCGYGEPPARARRARREDQLDDGRDA